MKKKHLHETFRMRQEVLRPSYHHERFQTIAEWEEKMVFHTVRVTV